MSAGFRDARRRAEAARRQLARFLESTGDAFMAFDREWHYMYVNPRAAQFARLPAGIHGRAEPAGIVPGHHDRALLSGG